MLWFDDWNNSLAGYVIFLISFDGSYGYSFSGFFDSTVVLIWLVGFLGNSLGGLLVGRKLTSRDSSMFSYTNELNRYNWNTL